MSCIWHHLSSQNDYMNLDYELKVAGVASGRHRSVWANHDATSNVGSDVNVVTYSS